MTKSLLLLPVLVIAVILCGPVAACSSSAVDEVDNAETSAPGTVIPAEFHAGLFVATPVLQTGDTARFFTDTGGGLFIYSDAAEVLGVSVDSSGFALLPSFRPLEGASRLAGDR